MNQIERKALLGALVIIMAVASMWLYAVYY